MNNGYPPYPPYPPRPYGPDWPGPNVHPDWPHYRYWHHWNDSEPAALVPWNTPCCPPSADECVCVTYQDINLWNSISAVMGFTALNINDFSGLSALSGISEMLSAAWVVGENWENWTSAASAVPDIYGKLSAISAQVAKKAYYSATSACLKEVYADPTYFVGNGTKDHVLRFNPIGELAFEKVLSVTYEPSADDPENPNSYPYTLVTNKECDVVMKNITELKESVHDLSTRITALDERVTALEDAEAAQTIANNVVADIKKRITKLEKAINN